MKIEKKVVLAAFAMTCGMVSAQTREARIVRGEPDWGKCSVQIVVDGTAIVEIRGTTATLRDVSGQRPEWRRFECTSPMPPNANVRFSREEGRGRIEMIREPREGGVAVIRIDDPQGGAFPYGFELTWNARAGYSDRGERQYDRDRREPAARFTEDEAVRSCQDAIRAQVSERFRGRPIDFRRTAVDDTPGRGEWVTGRFMVRRGYEEEMFRFSCAVDWGGRRVREAHFEPADR
jgi:hypothetical protein